MRFLESVRIALAMLRMHKLRAFLTMLGVIIGVMSVSLIVIVTNAFKSYISTSFSGLAADGIYIIYDPSRLSGRGRGNFSDVSEETKTYILEKVPSIRTVTGMVEAGNRVVKGNSRETKDVKFLGVDLNNNEFFTKKLVTGRLLNGDDIDGLRNVAVVSEEVVKELFAPPGAAEASINYADAIGKVISAPGITLEIVGVIEQPPQIGGPPSAKVIEIPVTTAQRKWLGGRSFTYLMARAKEGVTVGTAMEDVWQALMQKTDNRPVYRVDSNEAVTGIFSSILGGIGAVLAGIAALSLLVGGIGIMNIMLVSVTERTREIGLRKAVGATRSAVLSQFIVEAAILSLVGGLIGMALAFGLGQIVQLVTVAIKFPNENGLQAAFPLVEALMAAAFSAAIGVIFGFFPALSASRLDPIVALRTE